jgi:DNA-directed RNA polymerase subunit RPC12/RpoP
MSDQLHRDTDAPFGPEEADRILAALARREDLACPRCGGPLEHAGSDVKTASQLSVHLVRCPNCRRAVFASQSGNAR